MRRETWLRVSLSFTLLTSCSWVWPVGTSLRMFPVWSNHILMFKTIAKAEEDNNQ